MPGSVHLISKSQMHLNERPPSYASDANNASFPPPSYRPKTNDNDNSNTEFNETSSYRRLDFNALSSFMNSGGHRASNSNNNTPTALQRSDTWFERMFQVNTRGYHTFTKVDTQMGNWSIVCIAIQGIAAAILLCVSGVAIKLFQNPWNQSQVIGGATLSYALAGSILGCITVCFSFFTFDFQDSANDYAGIARFMSRFLGLSKPNMGSGIPHCRHLDVRRQRCIVGIWLLYHAQQQRMQ